MMAELLSRVAGVGLQFLTPQTGDGGWLRIPNAPAPTPVILDPIDQLSTALIAPFTLAASALSMALGYKLNGYVHEGGHWAMGRFFGYHPEMIVDHQHGILATRFREAVPPKQWIAIAAAGPVASLLAGGAVYGLSTLYQGFAAPGIETNLAVTMLQFGAVPFLVSGFWNLVPRNITQKTDGWMIYEALRKIYGAPEAAAETAIKKPLPGENPL